MNITKFNLTSQTLDIEFFTTAPICVLHGRYSDLTLDLLRELIGDYGAENDPDRIDDGRFVIHADVEIDAKNYGVCYIRNADFMGDNRLGVNFEHNTVNFSKDDTHEFVAKCNERDTDDLNVLIKTADLKSCDDDRPIFIYDYFDRLDEAVNIKSVLDKLASLDRQVFISVCENYPCDKIKHANVQIINV